MTRKKIDYKKRTKRLEKEVEALLFRNENLRRALELIIMSAHVPNFPYEKSIAHSALEFDNGLLEGDEND